MTEAIHPVFVLLELLPKSAVRHFVGSVPQGTPFPYARVTGIFSDHKEYMDGPSGLAQATIQVDWWDTDPDRFNVSIETARKRLSGTRGLVSTPAGDMDVRRVHMIDGELDAEQANDGSAQVIYHCRQDYRVDYAEVV